VSHIDSANSGFFATCNTHYKQERVLQDKEYELRFNKAFSFKLSLLVMLSLVISCQSIQPTESATPVTVSAQERNLGFLKYNMPFSDVVAQLGMPDHIRGLGTTLHIYELNEGTLILRFGPHSGLLVYAELLQQSGKTEILELDELETFQENIDDYCIDVPRDSVQYTTNNYAYAWNFMNHPITHDAFSPRCLNGFALQPGDLSGRTFTELSRDGIIDALRADANTLNSKFVENIEANVACPSLTYKIALFIDPGKDYLFYRQNPDGTFSCKLGDAGVTSLDPSGNLIIDPRTADRSYPGHHLNYEEFGGFFCIENISLRK
jgi:hypothetical protein